MILYIAGRKIELSDKTKVAQTKQANDLISLNTRQTNYTNRFKIPLTSSNKKALAFLGIVGSTSQLPYQRNEVYLYSDSGECFIYNGFAVIKSTNKKEYDINIYDGNIDIYKAIENKNLSSLDLSEISHTKDLTNVVNSFTADLNYKYIIADYNGKALYDTDKINIDFLVPSVKVKYLWDKIFTEFGYTYSGSVFDTFDFNNLWMTYPKGILSTVPDIELYDSNDLEFERTNPAFVDPENVQFKQSSYLFQNSNTTDDLQQIFDDRHFKVFDSGQYRVQIGGEIRIESLNLIGGIITNLTTVAYPVEGSLWLAKNSENITNSDNVTLVQLLQSNIGSNTDFNVSTVLDINTIVNLQDDESLCFVIVNDGNPNRNVNRVVEVQEVTLNIAKVENEIINFDDAFINFKIKDFFNEVLYRYGITPYKDKYTNNYNFLTLQELLQTAEVVDWSSNQNKFNELISETYIYGNYAQQNVFRHKYNDENDDYYDGNILIDNENLQASRNAISSKIYVPEELQSNVFEKQTNVYKLWDKEPKDDGTTNYKSLSKRFYFLREEEYSFTSPQTIGSEQLITEQVINSAPFESFFGLSYSNAIQEYYLPIYNILNEAKIYKANIFLEETDVTNIDFTKLYYIKELGGYFVLNKVVNFISRGNTQVELIKVNYNPIQNIDAVEVINSISSNSPDLINVRVRVYYDETFSPNTTIDYYLNGVASTINNIGVFEFNVHLGVPQQQYEIYLTDGTVTSETKYFLA